MKKLRALPLCCILLAVIMIGIYIYNFRYAPLSNDTSDWGAWGSYVNIGLSLISISLIYITYKEQQISNKTARFEEHYHVVLKTASELFEEKKDIINATFHEINGFIKDPFDQLTEYTQINTKKVMAFYYSSVFYDAQQDYNAVFRYFYSALNFIKNETIIDEKEKLRYYTEMSCIFSEEARILFLFWGYYTKHDVSEFYPNGMFRMSKNRNKGLENIIRFACIGERPQKEKVNLDEIDLDYYKNEDFRDTYNRLFNNKDKEQ